MDDLAAAEVVVGASTAIANLASLAENQRLNALVAPYFRFTFNVWFLLVLLV
jgi:hypothetical protein